MGASFDPTDFSPPDTPLCLERDGMAVRAGWIALRGEHIPPRGGRGRPVLRVGVHTLWTGLRSDWAALAPVEPVGDSVWMGTRWRDAIYRALGAGSTGTTVHCPPDVAAALVAAAAPVDHQRLVVQQVERGIRRLGVSTWEGRSVGVQLSGWGLVGVSDPAWMAALEAQARAGLMPTASHPVEGTTLFGVAARRMRGALQRDALTERTTRHSDEDKHVATHMMIFLGVLAQDNAPTTPEDWDVIAEVLAHSISVQDREPLLCLSPALMAGLDRSRIRHGLPERVARSDAGATRPAGRRLL